MDSEIYEGITTRDEYCKMIKSLLDENLDGRRCEIGIDEKISRWETNRRR